MLPKKKKIENLKSRGGHSHSRQGLCLQVFDWTRALLYLMSLSAAWPSREKRRFDDERDITKYKFKKRRKNFNNTAISWHLRKEVRGNCLIVPLSIRLPQVRRINIERKIMNELMRYLLDIPMAFIYLPTTH